MFYLIIKWTDMLNFLFWQFSNVHKRKSDVCMYESEVCVHVNVCKPHYFLLPKDITLEALGYLKILNYCLTFN